MGKSTIKWSFSIAMLNYQRVDLNLLPLATPTSAHCSAWPHWQLRRARMPGSLYGWELLPGPAKCRGLSNWERWPAGGNTLRRRLDDTVPPIDPSVVGSADGHGYTEKLSTSPLKQDMSLLVLLTLTKLKHWLTNHSRIIPTYLHIPYASISQDFYCSKIWFTTSICRYILITSSLYPLPTLGFAPHWGFVVHILFQLQKGVAHHHLHRAWDGRGAGGSGGWPLPLFRFFDQPDPTGNLAGKSIWNETILPPEVDFNCHLCRLPKYRSDTQPREMGLTDWNPQGRSQLSILSRAEDGVNWVNFMQAPRTLMMSMKNDMKKITLLRVIPTMTSIRFVTGKSSGILSDISSGILSGISSGILSGISSGILPGISSAICSGISSGTLSGISSGILSDILSGVLSGISSGILSGRWGPAVLTELGGSQVEVQRCSLSSEGPRLRSSCAQCAQTLAVEVRQCPLRAEVGEELGKELARRKWTWKWRQRWWRRTRRRRRTALIKSNNPHLAGGERHNCRLKQHLCKHLRPSKFLDISNQICQIEASWLAIVSKTREGKNIPVSRSHGKRFQDRRMQSMKWIQSMKTHHVWILWY